MAKPRIINVLTFPETHEVVGHGRARNASSARSNQAEVEVVLAPLGRNLLFEPKVPTVSSWIGCGELATVPVGSRWRNGKAVGSRRMPDAFVGEGKITSISTISLRDWGGGKGAAYFPINGVASGPCFVFELKGGTLEKVIVPMTEVLRTMFGRTSDLLLQLYGGRVADEARRFQIPERPENPERLLKPDPDGKLSMRYERAPSRQEALIAAMVLTDDRLAESFFGVSNDLRSSLRWHDVEGVPVVATCPLGEGTRIAFEGRWIGRASPPSRLFLVTRLLSATYTPAFRLLEVSFPSSKVDPRLPANYERTTIGPVETIHVRAERDPAPGRPTLEIETPGAVVTLVTGVDFRLLPEEPESAAPQSSVRVEDDRDDAEGSSGDAVQGGDRKVRRVTTRDEDLLKGPDPREVSMSATHAAIKTFAASHGWKTSYYRGVPFEDVGQGFRILLVGVVAGGDDGVEVMICDGGESNTKTRSIGLVRKSDGTPFDARDMKMLKRFILDEDAHWRGREKLAAAKDWIIAPVLRDCVPSKNLALYAERIAVQIGKLIRSEDKPSSLSPP
jgi:hypothetical protein